MRFSEQSVNTVLAELIFEKLSGWFNTIVPGYIVQYRRAELDIFLAELFGLKVVVEAKVGHAKIGEAVDKCKERLVEGLADICIAVAYSEKVRDAVSVEELRKTLKSGQLRVKIVQSDASEIDLGSITLDSLVDMLNKHRVYDKVVSRELVEEVAKEIRQYLDEVEKLDSNVLRNAASIIEGTFEIHGGVSEEEDEGE